MRTLFAALLAVLVLSTPAAAVAETAAPWFRGHPAIRSDVARGRLFVTLVVVPLCDNDLIDCGSRIAGKPADLEHNLYWGAVFGQKRFFDRKTSGWQRISDERRPSPVLESRRAERPLESRRAERPLESRRAERPLERTAFARRAPRAAWDAGGSGSIEQIVVLEAFDGRATDRALDRFFEVAAHGGRVTIRDGSRERELPVHVVGWAGHNRLMDGVSVPSFARSAGAIPSFVMACSSQSYFTAPLRKVGSEPLLTTRSLMAPEGYVVDAIVRALGDGASLVQVRASAVDAYAHWQKLSRRAAGGVFADVETPE